MARQDEGRAAIIGRTRVLGPPRPELKRSSRVEMDPRDNRMMTCHLGPALKRVLRRSLPKPLYRGLIQLYGLLYIAFRVCPIQPRKIVVCSYFGNGYGDNPKYILEEIRRRGWPCDVVWLVRDDVMRHTQMPAGVRTVRIGSLKAIYETVTAKVWIDNARKPWYVKKRRGQYYVQTWHGGPAFKRVEKDAADRLSSDYVLSAQHDSRNIDVCLSNCRRFTELITRSFWYDGEVLECGFPRNDILTSPSPLLVDSIRLKLGLSPQQRVALYAPTFRNHLSADAYPLAIDQCLAALAQRFTGDWSLLVRRHPNVQSEPLLRAQSDQVLDATPYEDLQELLCVVEVVITDYSSVMFDGALQQKPVFLFTPDLEQYKSERNFYFSLDELPFMAARDNAGLSRNIAAFDQTRYQKALDVFFNDIGLAETGEAAKAVVNRIEREIAPNKPQAAAHHPPLGSPSA